MEKWRLFRGRNATNHPVGPVDFPFHLRPTADLGDWFVLRNQGFVMDVKFGKEFYAVLVHSCQVTGAVDTMLFGDVEMAKCFCNVRWDLPEDEWEAYLVASDHSSTLKLNGEGVRYCGWKQELDEGEEFHIHLERKVVEF